MTLAFDPLPCPHCGASSRLEPHPLTLWACGTCGGPRIPAALLGSPPAPAALARLRAARDELHRALRERFRGGATLVLVVASLGLAGLVALLSKGVALGIALFSLALVLFVVFARRRAAAHEEAGRRALDAAWGEALGPLLGAKGAKTAAEVAALAGIDAAQAERLLTALATTDGVRVDVGDDGNLRYGTGLRIAADAPLETDLEADAAAPGLRNERP